MVRGWFRGIAGAGTLVHPVAGAIQWLWSFRRLWVAAISRHSDRAAALPRRRKRVIPRLCLICPKTGSMLCRRLM
jgi:hypothetical protein